MKRYASGGAAAALALAGAAWGNGVAVEIVPEEAAYRVYGRFTTAAAPETVFAVLTDYEGIAGFVSSVETSRVLRRAPGRALIEQRGTGRFLFVTRSVTLTLEVLEARPALVSFRDMDGRQFRRYEGAWRIEPSSGGSAVFYELIAEPYPGLGPRFAARRALKSGARLLLEEVRAEIEKQGRLP